MNRLLGGTVGGIIGVIIMLAYGGQELGLPVLSMLTGLGIGGLAVALAIRPTLENLIGGVILYIDRPIRVGYEDLDAAAGFERLSAGQLPGEEATQKADEQK